MEPTIYKPGAYNTPGVYKGAGGIYNGAGVYNYGAGGGGGNIVNIGGRDYKFVEINGKLWLAENLDYKFEYNGGQLPIGTAGMVSTPCAWYYQNDESQYGIDKDYRCGLLYNWYAQKYLNDNKALLLPQGWRVPEKTDFDNLMSFIANANRIKVENNSILPNWPTNWNGNNELEMSILPAGLRNMTGSFFDIGIGCYITPIDDLGGDSCYNLSFNSGSTMSQTVSNKKFAGSVRLIKDL